MYNRFKTAIKYVNFVNSSDIHLSVKMKVAKEYQQLFIDSTKILYSKIILEV